MSSPQESYVAGGGFQKEKMVKLLDDEMHEALALGFSGFRGTGDLGWAAHDARCCNELLEYEAMLERHLPGTSIVGICMYDASMFSEDELKKVIRAHRFALTSSSADKRSMRIRKGEIFGDVVFDSKSPSRFEYMVQRDSSSPEVLRAGEETSLPRAIDAVESALRDQNPEGRGRAADESDSQWLASAS